MSIIKKRYSVIETYWAPVSYNQDALTATYEYSFKTLQKAIEFYDHHFAQAEEIISPQNNEALKSIQCNENVIKAKQEILPVPFSDSEDPDIRIVRMVLKENFLS